MEDRGSEGAGLPPSVWPGQVMGPEPLLPRLSSWAARTQPQQGDCLLLTQKMQFQAAPGGGGAGEGEGGGGALPHLCVKPDHYS